MVIKVDAPFLSLAHIIASLIPKWVLKKFLVCTLDYNLQQPFIIIEGNKKNPKIRYTWKRLVNVLLYFVGREFVFSYSNQPLVLLIIFIKREVIRSFLSALK